MPTSPSSASPPLVDISPFLPPSRDNLSAPTFTPASTPTPTPTPSPAATAAAAALLDSSVRFGYAHICGHGIPPSVTAGLLSASHRFFTARARAESNPSEAAQQPHLLGLPARLALSPATYRGYQRVGENVTQGRRDVHRALDYIRRLAPGDACLAEESVRGGGEELARLACGENVFPSREVEEGVDRFMDAAVRAGRAVMAAICLALSLPEEEALGRAFRDPFYLVRLIHYPAQDHRDGGRENGAGEGDGGGELGCGGHRDYGCLTFIVSSEEAGADSALEVSKTGAEDAFVPALVPPSGGMLLNFGDCLEILSGGLLPATLHRVVRPEHDRTSIAAFVEPTFSWPIGPIQSVVDVAPPALRSRFSSSVDAEGYRRRLAQMQKYSCYGQYLLSKVRSNFSLYSASEEK